MSDPTAESGGGVTEGVARIGGVSYLRVPAADPEASARFYAAVFGWTVDIRDGRAGFSDATGHVIGHFVADGAAAGEAGIRPYVFVKDVPATLAAATTAGATVVDAPYPEGTLTVATFRDPSGNVTGIWQAGAGAEE